LAEENVENLLTTFVLLCCGGGLLLIFGGAGIFAIYTGRKSVRQADASQGWPATTGKITDAHVSYSSGMDSDGDSTDSYSACVSYEYQVLGQLYTGTKISFGFAKAHNSRGQAENDLARYPLGSQVTIYYDPSNPTEAVLERKAGNSVLATILGAAFILLSLCIACPLIFSGLAAAVGTLTGSN
jgi:hypothetical protein